MDQSASYFVATTRADAGEIGIHVHLHFTVFSSTVGNLTKPRGSQQFRYRIGYAPILAKPPHIPPRARGFFLTKVVLIRGEPLECKYY